MQVVGALRGIGKIIAFLEENLISGQTKQQGLKHNKTCFVFTSQIVIKMSLLACYVWG